MIDKNTRGSEWRKWDLYIHSNASDGKGTSEGELNIEVLYSSSTTRDYSVVQLKGKRQER